MKYILMLLIVLSSVSFAGELDLFNLKMGVVSYDLSNDWKALECPLAIGAEYNLSGLPIGLSLAPVLVNQDGQNGTSVNLIGDVGLAKILGLQTSLGYGTRIWYAQRAGGLVNFDNNQFFLLVKLK